MKEFRSVWIRSNLLERICLAGGLIFCIIGMLVMLSGCAPDPRSQAEAYATTLKANQDAANQEQARMQAQTQFELTQAEQQAESAQRVKFWNTFIQYATWSCVFAVFGLMLGVGKGSFEAFRGLGEAVALAARNKAERVYMDPETMSFPLIPVYEGSRQLAVHNPNDGSFILFDLAKPADQQKIAGMIAQGLAIGVARQARMHKTDPTGVAMVGTNPLLVGVREERDGALHEVGEFSRRVIVDALGVEADDGDD